MTMAADDPRDGLALGSVPVPDPTRLTTDAVDKATDQWRRELSAARELLEAQIAANLARIEGAARERADQIHAVRELLETRFDAMDKAQTLLAADVASNPAQFAAAREQIMATAAEQLQATRELLETRFDAMDKAQTLLAANVDKVPYAILQEAGNLKALLQREILNVQDVATQKFEAIEGTFASNALALTAALAAQKEAAAEQNKSNTLAITKSEQATKETIAANATQTATGQSSLSRELADLKERLVRIESGGVATASAKSERRLDAGLNYTAASVLLGFLVLAISLYAALHR
jgi:hypothetical protein